jgi:hypothetical protein
VKVADPYLTLLQERGKLPEMGRRQPCSTTRWRLRFLALLAPYSGKTSLPCGKPWGSCRLWLKALRWTKSKPPLSGGFRVPVNLPTYYDESAARRL